MNCISFSNFMKIFYTEVKAKFKYKILNFTFFSIYQKHKIALWIHGFENPISSFCSQEI